LMSEVATTVGPQHTACVRVPSCAGRDPAMFSYLNACFPGDHYRRLAVHFSIDALAWAQESVSTRMLQEMKTGRAALSSLRAATAASAAENRGAGALRATVAAVRALVKANAGGPYGSAMLGAVQVQSDTVWSEVLAGRVPATQGWLTADIEIHKEPFEGGGGGEGGGGDAAGAGWWARAAVPGASVHYFQREAVAIERKGAE
jgi:hypothetical protein